MISLRFRIRVVGSDMVGLGCLNFMVLGVGGGGGGGVGGVEVREIRLKKLRRLIFYEKGGFLVLKNFQFISQLFYCALH